MKNKKGQSVNAAIFTLIFLAIGLVVTGVVIAFGANFVDEQRTDIALDNLAANCGQNSTGGSGGVIAYTNCGYAYNATGQSLSAMQDVAEGQGTVTTVAILAIVVGLLLGVVALFGFMRGRENQI